MAILTIEWEDGTIASWLELSNDEADKAAYLIESTFNYAPDSTRI